MSDAPKPARPRPHVEASRRVAQIMRAAEDAAIEIQAEAERRSDERIAEASRAAENRVGAAEEEAKEILEEAQRKAAVLNETSETSAGRLRDEAKAEANRLLEEARQQADEVQRIAEVFSVQTREAADEDARKRVGRARDLASEVLADGTEMAHNLNQLADSLRKNAEVLLSDVTRAHRALTARLDEAGIDEPRADRANGTDTSLRRAEPDFGDIPEFIPRSPRKSR